MTTPRLASAAILLLLAAPAQAASGPASLACIEKKGPSGKKEAEAEPALALKGLIPATAQALDLTLTVGSGSVAMTAEAGDRVAVVDAFADRVFALVVFRPQGPPLRLYARPRTLKVRKDAHSVHARFDAIVLELPSVPASEKPEGAAKGVGRILSCLYDYEV